MTDTQTIIQQNAEIIRNQEIIISNHGEAMEAYFKISMETKLWATKPEVLKYFNKKPMSNWFDKKYRELLELGYKIERLDAYRPYKYNFPQFKDAMESERLRKRIRNSDD